MSIPRRLTCTLSVLGLLVAFAPAGRTSFGSGSAPGSHLWVVNEIFSSPDGSVQFIELKECCGSPIEWEIGGKDVFSLTNNYTFPNHIPAPTDTANKHILLATAAFAALPGAPNPDHIIQENFFSIDTDEIHWHVYPNATLTFGPGDLPLDGVLSLNQDLSTAPNSPTNFWDQSGHVDIGPSILHVASCGNDSWTGTSPDCQAPDGPKATIQAAIDTAAEGDEVLVAPGTYAGGVDFDAKAVWLHSSDGEAATTIQGMVDCSSGEGPGSILEGFTISRYPDHGRGMLCRDSEPTVRHCTFAHNEVVNAEYGGGAMEISGPRAPTITHCTFQGNIARGIYEAPGCGSRGGAIHLRGAHLTVTSCVFSKNLALGLCQAGPAPYGGAIFIRPHTQAHLTVIGCTFAGNISEGPGSYSNAIFTSGSAMVKNSAIGRAQFMTGAIVMSSCYTPMFVRDPGAGLNVMENGPGGDFGDLRLRPGSPCIDAGDNGAVPRDVTTDCDGNPRFVDDCGSPNSGTPGGAGGTAVVDPGAFEFQGIDGVSSYCSTSPNTVGPGALMGWSGSVSIAANDLVLYAGPIIPGEVGLFFHGGRRDQKPFGNGFLCTDGPAVRGQAFPSDRNGALMQPFDNTGPDGFGVLPGVTRYFQAWYRDHAEPAGFNLSDALEIRFLP